MTPERYGLHFTIDSLAALRAGTEAADSMIQHRTRLGNGGTKYNIEHLRRADDRTADFYLLVFLAMLLGLIRFSDPRYFEILLRTFRNPHIGRHGREQIQGAALSNLLMNVFFTIVAGAYVYYSARLLEVSAPFGYRTSLLLPVLIAGMLAMYLAKYLVVRFSGWAFRIEDITDQYIFNVFLINKVIGVVLLPFVMLIAFAGPDGGRTLLLVSGLIVLALLVNRYTRSWPVFSSFFQHSRFHFFTYLCASEILPMAVIVKLLLRFL